MAWIWFTSFCFKQLLNDKFDALSGAKKRVNFAPNQYFHSVFLSFILGPFWAKSVEKAGVHFLLRDFLEDFCCFSKNPLVFPFKSQKHVFQNTFLSFSLAFCSLFKNHYKNAAKSSNICFWAPSREFCRGITVNSERQVF